MRLVCVFAALVLMLAFESAGAADDCQTAALNYYCTGVTLALAQGAREADLSMALKIKARDYGAKADRLGYKDLADKYQKAGVEDAAKSGDSEVMKRLMATCLSPERSAMDQFMNRAKSDCSSDTTSSRPKSD